MQCTTESFMARELTGKQKAFLQVLFDEAGGNMVTAKKMAGYSDTSSTAKIVKGLGGFETQAPNLKTFFINYLNANLETGQKKFIKGEKLNLLKPDNGSGVFEQVKVDNVNVTFTADNSSDEYAGDSFGVSCEEGVIYQKGHFIFVER